MSYFHFEEYVYVLTNRAMPNMVKIGKTRRRPEDRIAELSSSTGVPLPFKLAYYRKVRDSTAAEREIHSRLNSSRVNARREFFWMDVAEAKRVVDTVCSRYPVSYQNTIAITRHPILRMLRLRSVCVLNAILAWSHLDQKYPEDMWIPGHWLAMNIAFLVIVQLPRISKLTRGFEDIPRVSNIIAIICAIFSMAAYVGISQM